MPPPDARLGIYPSQQRGSCCPETRHFQQQSLLHAVPTPLETQNHPPGDSVQRTSLPRPCLLRAKALLRRPDRTARLCRELSQQVTQWFPNPAAHRKACELSNLPSRGATHHGCSLVRGPGPPSLTLPHSTPPCHQDWKAGPGPRTAGLLGRWGTTMKA